MPTILTYALLTVGVLVCVWNVATSLLDSRRATRAFEKRLARVDEGAWSGDARKEGE